MNSTTTPAITVAIQHQLDANRYINLISYTLLFYDYLLTLPWETARFWGSSFQPTAANVLFFLNRYVTLFGTVPVVMQYFWTGEAGEAKIAPRRCSCALLASTSEALISSSCTSLATYHQYFVVFTQIIIGFMLILRTYALYQGSRRVLALMLVVAAYPITVGTWSVLSASHSEENVNDAPPLGLYVGCSSGVPSSEKTKLAIAWVGLAVFDCTIFLLTLWRGLRRYLYADRGRRRREQLVEVLLRDGSIYFGVILLSTIANIITFVIAEPYARGILTTFTNVISTTMISRLMLNLRDPALVSPGPRSPSVSGGWSEMHERSTTSAGMFTTSDIHVATAYT
ncbi:hypothetical protein MKEN_01305400 [Mycena kentingensis (nom. inval.)]|nr:hypothetical protein MKEN_01305400 [Mycena kentingensis (nom. inval.)]